MNRLDPEKLIRALLAWLWPPSRRSGGSSPPPSTPTAPAPTGLATRAVAPKVQGRRITFTGGPAGLVGSICFEYEDKTISFGSGLGRDEAGLIIERMRQRYPFP